MAKLAKTTSRNWAHGVPKDEHNAVVHGVSIPHLNVEPTNNELWLGLVGRMKHLQRERRAS